MKGKPCPTCGAKMKKNGRTSAGTQRFRCVNCGASSTHKNDTCSRDLKAFLLWLLSKDRQIDMPGKGRSFRRKTKQFWNTWCLPDVVDEIHRVIYVDGIYITRNVVVLIACSDEYVLSWYLARSENSRAWTALLSNIAPPEVVVTDGGSGFAKAVKSCWPHTAIQRCTFHAFSQVRRYTTSKPKLQAGKELYELALDLLQIKTLHQANWWVERYFQWCEFWSDYLEEKSYVDGRVAYTHERLRKARRSLSTLINKGTLFTYLDPELTKEGPLPATNNKIEGKINGQIRSMLRNHRGLKTTRRIKAVFWFCYMHTECPKSAREIIETMPKDEDIDVLYETYGVRFNNGNEPVMWGEGLVWEEFHHKTFYPYSVD